MAVSFGPVRHPRSGHRARTLDEVLSAKSALDEELRAYVRLRLEGTGIEVTELGVKDVILPGEIRLKAPETA